MLTSVVVEKSFMMSNSLAVVFKFSLAFVKFVVCMQEIRINKHWQ